MLRTTKAKKSPSLNYDLEVLVPVSSQGKFASRLRGFKKYGLLDAHNHKILVKLLVGTEQIPEIEVGWGEGVTIEVVPCKLGDPPAVRVYDYYASVDVTSLQAKWYMRVDDDGFTHIDTLMQRVLPLNHNKNYYFGTHSHHLWPNIVERTLLQELGHELIISKVRHEHECCINSLSSIRSILGCKAARQLFAARARRPDHPICDRCWGCGAYLAGEKLAVVNWLNREPPISKFSYFGGPICHIHEIAPDKHKANWNVFTHCIKNFDKVSETSAAYLITGEKGTAELQIEGVAAQAQFQKVTDKTIAEQLRSIEMWCSIDKVFCLCNHSGHIVAQFKQNQLGEHTGTFFTGFGTWRMEQQ